MHACVSNKLIHIWCFILYRITLRRGPSGLGFTFVGGNDIPFYIKDIAKDGVADKHGQLQRGDQLLAINGVSIQGSSYQYVLETLKKLHGDVKLTVISAL